MSPTGAMRRFGSVFFTPSLRGNSYSCPATGLTSGYNPIKFWFQTCFCNWIRSPCAMEDLTGARPEYQDFRKSLRDNEGGQTVADALTYRWWQFLCAVSATNILLWILAAWGVSQEADGYQFKQ